MSKLPFLVEVSRSCDVARNIAVNERELALVNPRIKQFIDMYEQSTTMEQTEIRNAPFRWHGVFTNSRNSLRLSVPDNFLREFRIPFLRSEYSKCARQISRYGHDSRRVVELIAIVGRRK